MSSSLLSFQDSMWCLTPVWIHLQHFLLIKTYQRCFCLLVGWFFVFCYHFFPPSGLTLISWGKQGGEPTGKIPFLRCVFCFFVADHNDNILHLFAILQFQNRFCVWASLILRLQGGVDLWVGKGPGGNGAEQEWVTEPSFPYSFFHF